MEPESRVGTHVGGRYRVERMLGVGGMAAVYAAVDEPTGDAVVVKVLHWHVRESAKALARFEREAQALGSLGHPGIPRILDFGLDHQGESFLVMPFEEGITLRDRLSQGGPLRPADAVTMALEVLSALGAAHAQGIVHRDVKPANVLLVGGPTKRRAKVLDFGVAKLVADIGHLTETGATIGTLAYMAPEQAAGAGVGPSADVYSVGATLYHALTGARPFVTSVPRELYLLVRDGSPRPIRALVSDVPPGLVSIVERAMAKNPMHRFESAKAMSDALAGEASSPDRPRPAAGPLDDTVDERLRFEPPRTGTTGEDPTREDDLRDDERGEP